MSIQWCQNVAEIHSFCTRVFCFLLFSIWLHSTNLHLELEYRILCSIVSAWNRYKYILIIFKKWLWVLKIVANISRSFLKIISNKVARSLTVTSGFEILFAKIPLDIFRFTIYIYTIGQKLIKKYIENKIWFSKQYYLYFPIWNNCIYFMKFQKFWNKSCDKAYIYNFKIYEYKRKFNNSIFVNSLFFSSFVNSFDMPKNWKARRIDLFIKNFIKIVKFNLLILSYDLITKPNQT